MAVATVRLITYGGLRLIPRTEAPDFAIRGQKTRALFAYLALMGATPRSTLQHLLWQDASPQAGRHSLSQTLSDLRRQLARIHPRPLAATSQSVSLTPGFVTPDVGHVERLLRRPKGQALRIACRICSGEFLPGMTIQEPAFEAWLAEQRIRARRLAFEAHWHFASDARARGRTVDALRSALRLVDIDPADQRGHLLLMTLYAEQEQVGAALYQYDECRRHLQARQTRPGVAIERLRARLLGRPEVPTGPAIDRAEGSYSSPLD